MSRSMESGIAPLQMARRSAMISAIRFSYSALARKAASSAESFEDKAGVGSAIDQGLLIASTRAGFSDAAAA